jgi:hypothetical protein
VSEWSPGDSNTPKPRAICTPPSASTPMPAANASERRSCSLRAATTVSTPQIIAITPQITASQSR